MQKFKFYILIITFLLSFTTISFSHDGATGIVKDRMEKFKASKSIMRQINKSFDNKDFSIPNPEQGPSMIKGIARDVLKEHDEVYLIRKVHNKVNSYFVFLKPKEI